MTYLDIPVDYAPASEWPSGNVAYGTLCDFYNAYHDSAETMKGDIESLNNSISVLKRQNSYANNLLANAKVIILEAFDNDDFDKDVVTNIAEALDITLVNNYDVTITVTYRGTIEIPMDEDIDNFENHISFEFSAPFSDEWNVDIYQDDIEINYDEVSWKD
jgi:hypothetical protein